VGNLRDPARRLTHVGSRTEKESALDFSHWGFRPTWAKEDAPTPINIRAEKAATSPYFRSAFAHRRCLIPANGWYEWRKTESGKEPYYITLKESNGPQCQDMCVCRSVWIERQESAMKH
jgi:putative SOS response-associated peptidase YedK